MADQQWRVSTALAICSCLVVSVQGFAPSLTIGSQGMQSSFRNALGEAGRIGAARVPRTSKLALRMGNTMSQKKVVVTGIGAVSPIGTGTDAFFTALMDGKTGFSQLPSWADEFPSNVAGAITDFNAGDWYKNKKEAKRQSRYMHLAIAASKLAVEDAKLTDEDIGDRDRYGVLISSAVGGTDFYEEAGTKWEKHSKYDDATEGESFKGRNSVFAGPDFMNGCDFTFEGFKKISPFIVPSFILNSGSGVAAVELDARGPNYCVGGYGGEAAGSAVAIMDAYRFISTDQTDIMVAGSIPLIVRRNTHY
eukprot:223676-Rhodomonas_salina.2